MTNKEYKTRMQTLNASAMAIIKKGVCPQCGSALYNNSAISGWYQCSCYPEASRRKAEYQDKPSCHFQVFAR